ncbi:MAG: DUF6036 family nucleotidyltransferase [Thermodesulfovibrionales bacterium]
MLNEDYKELLQILSENRVEYLVVGAYAMAMHGYPRATADLDIWVDASGKNSAAVYDSLAKFGAPVDCLTSHTFQESGLVFQVGVAPRRIDILTSIDGVEFGDAYVSREIIEIEGVQVPFLSGKDLVRNKESTGREKDRLDAACLRELFDN